jgi:hypothetical protein
MPSSCRVPHPLKGAFRLGLIKSQLPAATLLVQIRVSGRSALLSVCVETANARQITSAHSWTGVATRLFPWK